MRPEKVQQVAEIKERFLKAQGTYLIDFSGMDIEMTEELRDLFRKSELEYRVVKNTLTKRAFDEASFEIDQKYLKLPTGLVFSYKDPFSPARIINDFYKKHEKPIVKGSIIEGEVYNEKETLNFSSYPTKDELLARMLGGLNAPIANFVGILGATVRSLLYALQSLKEQKENQ